MKIAVGSKAVDTDGTVSGKSFWDRDFNYGSFKEIMLLSLRMMSKLGKCMHKNQ